MAEISFSLKGLAAVIIVCMVVSIVFGMTLGKPNIIDLSDSTKASLQKQCDRSLNDAERQCTNEKEEYLDSIGRVAERNQELLEILDKKDLLWEDLNTSISKSIIDSKKILADFNKTLFTDCNCVCKAK